MMVAGVADFGFEGACEFHPFSPEIIIVSGAEGACAVGDFSDAAEVVLGVIVTACICASDAFFSLSKVLFQRDGSRRIAFLSGLCAASPEITPVAGDRVRGGFLDDAGSSTRSIVGKLGAAVVRVGDLYQSIFRIPCVSAKAVAKGIFGYGVQSVSFILFLVEISKSQNLPD